MVLLGERLRQHADCSREPSFREEARKGTACAILIHFALYFLELQCLAFFRSRIDSRMFLLHIFDERILVRHHKQAHVRVLIVVENDLGNELGVFHKCFLNAFRRIFLSV